MHKRKPAKKPLNPVRRKGRHYSESTDELHKRCIRLMLANEWVTGESTLALMEEYKLGRAAVDKAAIAASRFIRLCRGDIREEILRSLDHAKSLALKAEMVVYDPENGFQRADKPDLAAFKSFLQMQAEVHGLIGKVSANAQRFDGNGEKVSAPIEELTGILESLGYEVTKKDDFDGESSDSNGLGGDERGDTGADDGSGGESEAG